MATLAELEPYFAVSPLLTWMRDNNIPLTRENYIDYSTALQPDYDWSEEDEAGMPEPLQDYEALAANRSD